MSLNKLSVIAAASLGLLSLSGQALAAGSATGSFNVTVGLTAGCQVKGTPSDLAFTYEAFQSGAASGSTSVTFKCTRGFGAAPTVQLDTGTDAAAAAAGNGTTGAGVVGGLKYTLTVNGGVKDLLSGNAATTSSIGTADEYSYAISGSMEAGQAGDSSKATSQTRTLTISY